MRRSPRSSEPAASGSALPVLRLLSPLLLASLLGLPAAATTVAQVLAGSSLEERVDDIVAGKKVMEEAYRSGQREMAVAFACLVPAGEKTSLDMFRRARAIMPKEYADADGPIDLRDLEGSLAALSLGGSARKEAQRYLQAEPGWELSLSTEEIARLRALSPAKGQEVAAVEGELRRIFAERVRSYHEQGLPGIAPFDRGSDGSSSVASDLEASTKASKSFEQILPKTWRALQSYPGKPPPDGQAFYFWSRIKVLGRPVFLLNQRLVGSFDGAPVAIERQFYATR